MIQGTLPEYDLMRAFVAGAGWWEYRKTGTRMRASSKHLAEDIAEKRYRDGQVKCSPNKKE